MIKKNDRSSFCVVHLFILKCHNLEFTHNFRSEHLFLFLYQQKPYCFFQPTHPTNPIRFWLPISIRLVPMSRASHHSPALLQPSTLNCKFDHFIIHSHFLVAFHSFFRFKLLKKCIIKVGKFQKRTYNIINAEKAVIESWRNAEEMLQLSSLDTLFRQRGMEESCNHQHRQLLYDEMTRLIARDRGRKVGRNRVEKDRSHHFVK